MERGDLGKFDVVEADVLNGSAILWLAASKGEVCAAAVTQIQETELSKVCVLLALGGAGFKHWKNLGSMIEQYARMFGCNKVRFEGRRGWARLAAGYEVKKIVMERQL